MTGRNDTPDAAYRKLVERLFLRHWHSMSNVEPRLLVGELPPGWDVPLPQGAQVIGSHIQHDLAVQVALGVPGGPEQAAADVERRLTQAGWRRNRFMGPRGGGFMPAAMGMYVGGVFCDDRHRRHLMVSVNPAEPDFSDVRLNLNSDPTHYTPCEQEMRLSPADIFPRLTAPPGVLMRPGGGGGGGGSAHTSATLFADVAVDRIEAHFREELTAAGWRASDHGVSGRWAWSTWEFRGERQESWSALLTVVEPPNSPATRVVYLQASAGLGPFGGATSVTSTFA